MIRAAASGHAVENRLERIRSSPVLVRDVDSGDGSPGACAALRTPQNRPSGLSCDDRFGCCGGAEGYVRHTTSTMMDDAAPEMRVSINWDAPLHHAWGMSTSRAAMVFVNMIPGRDLGIRHARRQFTYCVRCKRSRTQASNFSQEVAATLTSMANVSVRPTAR